MNDNLDTSIFPADHLDLIDNVTMSANTDDQVFSNFLSIELQLADSLEAGFVSDDAVSEADTQVTQHGGVGQVTLPAGNRQLAGQVLEDRVGYP